MKSFKQFIEERKVDPVKLGQRAARRFGQATNYPGHDFDDYKQKEDDDGDYVPKKHGHLPLRKYNVDKAEEVHGAFDKFHTSVAPRDEKGHPDYSARHIDKYATTERLHIKDLHPTQPFVATSREDLLRKKIENKKGEVPHTVTHGGKTYVMNGHHVIMGAALKGEKTVTTRNINLDSFKDQ